MNLRKRLALLLGVGLSLNVTLPNYRILASESYTESAYDAWIINEADRTTDSQIEIETPATTSSALLIVKNNRFDKNKEICTEVQIELVSNGSLLQQISNEEKILAEQQEYYLAGNEIYFDESYLDTLEVGSYTFDFLFYRGDNGENYTLTQNIECLDTTQVCTLIREAEEIISEAVIGTTPGSFYLRDELVFKMAIARAKEDIQEVENQQQADSVYNTLSEAVRVFKNSIICLEEDLNKEVLSAMIEKAEQLYNSVHIGSNPGMSSESNKIALEIAILDAKERMAEASTQNDIDTAAQNLITVIESFKAALVPYLRQDVNQDGRVDVQDLALVMYYYRVTSQDEIWEKAQSADINGDEVVDLLDLVETANKIIEK